MTTDIAKLLSPQTVDAVRTKLLALFTGAGFNTTAWQSGTLPRTLSEGESTYLSDLSTGIANVAASGFLRWAKGAWLSLLGEQFYQEPRNPAVFTQGVVVLTDHGGGPHTLEAGQLWVSDIGQAFRFNSLNTAPVTLPLNGSLSLTFQAETPDSAHNLGNGAIVELLTPLPTVTVANPARGPDPWITQTGTDAEQDDAYAIRLTGKWSTRGTGSQDAAYIYYARTASAEVTRAYSAGNPDTGIVTVTIGTAIGPVSDAAYAVVDAVIQAKKPSGVRVVTQNATASNSLVAGTLYVLPSRTLTAALADAQTAVSQYAASLPFGSVVYLAKLVDVLMNVDGVYNVVLTAPTNDLVLPVAQGFVPTFGLAAFR
jgi:uncharacterized phage protein gp47/JayE